MTKGQAPSSTFYAAAQYSIRRIVSHVSPDDCLGNFNVHAFPFLDSSAAAIRLRKPIKRATEQNNNPRLKLVTPAFRRAGKF